MGAFTEYELIDRAVNLALTHAEAVEADVVEQLQTSGSTVLVNSLRTLTMHSTIVAIGSLSVFEAILQQKKGWARPFAEVDALLREHGKAALADRFLDYRSAINVLKHGVGPSYDRLLARRDLLAFKVKPPGEAFFEEGNVDEGLRLIEADHSFVRQCSLVIEEVVTALRDLGTNAPSPT
jgi:hypothetical protein